ncbi:MAG: type IV pilin N-terminal domain-containing protein [Candidatus Thermoplasmatota archaeon]|nr:type IV pilin N-terminal domain-containing protein [Candidatus Thermoplasmatota archaeon]
MMKRIRKFFEKGDAVSAVIGVILMVAITVAIAATVYVYVSGMLSPVPTAAPNITGTVKTVDDNITITLSGEYVEITDARITVTDVNNSVASVEEPVRSYSYDLEAGAVNITGTLSSSCALTWIDASGDGNIGGGDLIKVQDPNGLDVGTWYVKVIQVSSGKPALDSEVKIT